MHLHLLNSALTPYCLAKPLNEHGGIVCKRLHTQTESTAVLICFCSSVRLIESHMYVTTPVFQVLYVSATVTHSNVICRALLALSAYLSSRAVI